MDRTRAVIEKCNKFNCSDALHYALPDTTHNDMLNLAIVSPVQQLPSTVGEYKCSKAFESGNIIIFMMRYIKPASGVAPLLLI